MGTAEQASMPQVAQDMRFAAPEVNENLEEERMQDILQRLDQSRAQPAGIEGLPAPNMQFAEGGVVGFAGDTDGSYVDPEAYDVNAAINLEREIMRQLAQDRVRRAQRPGTGRPTAASASAPVAAPAAAAAAAPAAGIAGLTEYDKKAAEAREEAEKRLKEPFARKAPTLEEIQAVTDKARQARGLTGAAGAHYDEQIAALKELFAQQAAERAAGASGRDRADLAAILSAGGKGGLRAVGERYAQISQTRAEEAERLRAQQVTQKQAVFTMQNAQVAMREAAAAGDMNAYRAAQQEFDAAQRAYETSKTSGILALAKEHGDVAKDMGTRSFQQQQLTQQAQLERDKMANAIKVAQIGASNRTAATELNPYQRAQLREKAADNVRQDKNLPTIILRAKQEATKNRVPFNEQEFVERLIERQYKILTGETPPPPAPPAGGIDPAILKQFKVTPVGG
jgi:hypothetical protein